MIKLHVNEHFWLMASRNMWHNGISSLLRWLILGHLYVVVEETVITPNIVNKYSGSLSMELKERGPRLKAFGFGRGKLAHLPICLISS